MALEFKLPDIGEGIAEGEIVKWHVAVGDQVAEHQTVVEVMTDKATVEIPAPAAGTIAEIRAAEGDVIPVGGVLFVLEKGAAAAGAQPASKPEARAAATATKSEPPKAVSAPRAEPSKVASAPKAEATKAASSPKVEPRPEPAAQRAAQAKPPQAPQPSPKGAGGTGGGMLEFKLPDIGEGIAEGEIVKWHVAVGDQVAEHQTVVEVMTDKATVEIPAPAAGTIAALQAKEGETVPVGTVIFRIATAGAPIAAAATVGAAPGRSTAAAPAAVRSAGEKVLAVPSARRVARELGIDLTGVPGSGRNGVVRRADVEAFAQSSPAEAPAAPAPSAATRAAPATPRSAPVSIALGDRETRKPFRGVRRKIAEAMTRSKFTAAHFTVVEEVDVTELVALREKAKAIGAEQDIKVTYMPFIMKAAAVCLFKFPQLNSQLDETTQELVTFHFVNMGIATDTENGLIVPVVPDVQSKGILQLASELRELADRTRSGKVKPEELKGGTFTITNAGNIGGILATPIINFPEVAILGVHKIVKRPGIVETPDGDEIAVRQYMNLSISVDHRLVDGADAVRFLVHMKTLLEDPGLIAL